MPIETAYRVGVSGPVDQARLDELRRLLNLTRRGRLTDDEDELFGYREDQIGGAEIKLRLYRAGERAWSLSVSYDNVTITPTDTVIDGYRDEILRAAQATGLTVGQEYRRGQTPPRGSGGSDPVAEEGHSRTQADHKQADRIVEALRRYVFRPGEDVQRLHVEPGRLRLLTTKQSTYEVARTTSPGSSGVTDDGDRGHGRSTQVRTAHRRPRTGVGVLDGTRPGGTGAGTRSVSPAPVAHRPRQLRGFPGPDERV